jgi:Leucine-rich repeat (LRR) protein
VKEHFQKLSQIPEIKDTIFTNLIMDNPQITHIPEGGFGDISFQSIHFKNANLERIHLKAFTASAKTAVILKIDSTKLQNEPRPYSVYDLANSFQNLIILSIGHEFDLLFEEGFNGNLTGLRDLSVKVNELEGSPFYEMSNLQNLIISDGKLSHLTPEAFKIGNRIDDQYLSIKFVNIETLNGSSFESGTFVNAQGPVSLSFDSCHVNYLHETVFGAFLDAHPGNTIESMASEPIDCSDCRTYWIFGRKSELQDRMNEVYCNGDSSGGDIWTSEDKFAHCKDWVGK